MGKLELCVGDITRLKVDAIVNAANSRLAGGGGVDGAIHRAAGSELAAACAAIGGCPTGEARITPGFDLPAEWIIHTVGPVWHGGEANETSLLESCYERSLDLALQHNVQTIAFPGISTGVYCFPKAKAAEIALGAVHRRQEEFKRIVLCCFSEADAAVYRGRASTLSIDLND